MSNPSVSVVLPVYNCDRFIAAALESVFAQSFTDWELVVVDDGSQDRTWELIQQYSADERVTLIRNERNLGQFPTHNRGAEAAQGRYIKFLHGDDLLYPHCLEIMVALMDAYPEAGVGISNNPAPWCAPKLLEPREVWSQYLLRKSSLMSKGPICSIFRADAFRTVGGYDPRFDSSDVKMNLTMAMAYPVLILPEGMAWYRIHDAQVSAGMRVRDTGQKEKITWLRELLASASFPLESTQTAHARAIVEREFQLLCRHYALRGEPKRAFKLWKASGHPWRDLFVSHSLPVENVLESELPAKTSIPDWNAYPGEPALEKPNGANRGVPLVSVVVDASSSAELFERSLESVCAQRYANFELILAGGESDRTVAAKEAASKGGLSIRRIADSQLSDKWAHYNSAAYIAQGKYLKFLEGGDLLYPNCLQTMVSMMVAAKGAALGVSGPCGPYRAGYVLDPDASLDSELFGTPRFLESPSSLIVDRERFLEAGGFEPRYFPAERRLQLKLSQLAPMLLIHGGLVQYGASLAMPFYGEEHWPLGWAQGYQWIVEWLLSIDHGLDEEQLNLAIGNFLRVAWQRRDHAEHPGREKKRILELARRHKVEVRELKQKPAFMRKGGSPEVAQRVKRTMLETPDWSYFGHEKVARSIKPSERVQHEARAHS